MPTATVVTTAFVTPARLAARSLHLDDLPLIVTPHPLNDLTPAQVRELAQAAYPLVLLHLTGQGAPEPLARVPFEHPARAAGTSGDGGAA